MNVKRILNVCPSACTHHSRIIRNLLGELAEKNLRFGEKLTHMGQRTTRAKLMSYFSAEAQRLGTYEFDVPFLPSAAGGLSGGGAQRTVAGTGENEKGRPSGFP